MPSHFEQCAIGIYLHNNYITDTTDKNRFTENLTLPARDSAAMAGSPQKA